MRLATTSRRRPLSSSPTSWLALGCLLTSLVMAPAVAGDDDEAKESALRESIVKISATMRAPDPLHPWSKQGPREGSGTGVVIEGKRILTNAHVVLYASQLFVESYQSSDKLVATVESISPGIDLAVLKLEDESFFEKRPPLPRTHELPAVKDSVLAYGYPQGGTSLSITKGIVSRIEFAPYGENTAGVRVQVDAAINPGNSGGPAIVDGQVVGLIFSRLSAADNIGYIIPSEEIDLFLEDVEDGKYGGKPAMHEASVIKAIVGLSNLMADAGTRIASIDVNPFLINTRVGVAVDGLIVLNNDAAKNAASDAAKH